MSVRQSLIMSVIVLMNKLKIKEIHTVSPSKFPKAEAQLLLCYLHNVDLLTGFLHSHLLSYELNQGSLKAFQLLHSSMACNDSRKGSLRRMH